MSTEVQNAPAPAPTDSGLSAELAFLQGKGEDIADLREMLESTLKREDAPAPAQTQPLQGTDRLPIREDGTLIEPTKATDKPVTPPAPVAQATEKPVTQADALDPYAVDAPRSKPEDIDAEPEPGEVVLDAEGKVRDAKTGRYVPHHAMHQERVRRKELEAELQKKDEAFARANERLLVLQEIMHGQDQKAKQEEQKATAPQPEAEIDPEVDIFGWAKQQKAQIEAAKKQLVEIAKQNEQQFGELNTQQKYRQDITAFAGQNADFFDAYKYVSNMRVAELQAMGFTDQKAIAAQIAAEERVLVQQHLSKGGSPAAILYALAKAKGFTGGPKPTASATQPAPAPAPAPTQAAPAAQQVVIPQPSQAGIDQVQRIQNGVHASATLSGAGGAPGEGLTVQQLAEMPDDQFDALVQKIGTKQFDKLLGGR